MIKPHSAVDLHGGRLYLPFTTYKGARQVAGVLDRGEVHQRIAGLLDVVRGGDDLVVLVGVTPEDVDWVKGQGGATIKV